MIIITGAAGMIGSVTAWHLNNILGENDLILCDDLAHENQEKNFSKRKYLDFVKKDQLLTSIRQIDAKKIDAIIHMGAISATTEKVFVNLIKDNIRFSQKLWAYCTEKKIPFIYASSAATYGDGSQGYDDDLNSGLKPLNAYGYSKYFFDRWALGMAEIIYVHPTGLAVNFLMYMVQMNIIRAEWRALFTMRSIKLAMRD